MSGSEEGSLARLIGLIADICGVISTIGLVIFAILNSRKIVNINSAQEPIVIAIIASAAAGVALLAQGLLVYFGRLAQFQRRSPWLNLILGIFLLLVAFGGWRVTR
jgi:hypothetical protein